MPPLPHPPKSRCRLNFSAADRKWPSPSVYVTAALPLNGTGWHLIYDPFLFSPSSFRCGGGDIWSRCRERLVGWQASANPAPLWFSHLPVSSFVSARWEMYKCIYRWILFFSLVFFFFCCYVKTRWSHTDRRWHHRKTTWGGGETRRTDTTFMSLLCTGVYELTALLAFCNAGWYANLTSLENDLHKYIHVVVLGFFFSFCSFVKTISVLFHINSRTN